MGCSNSKDNHQHEADCYAERKKNNFKDPGLEKHRQDCIQQKKKLHHVEDPDVARQQKKKKKAKANIDNNRQKKEETKGPIVGLTEKELQSKRNNLKHRT